MSRVQLRPFLLLALGASTLFATGCQTQPRIAGARVKVQPEGRLASVNPSDIAIAPVEVVAPSAAIPTEALRRSAGGFLPRKRYSPLRLENVDNAMVGTEPASYRAGALREDAVLELTVHAWDASLWGVRRTLTVDVEARFVEPGRASGAPLWTGRLSQRFDFTGLERGASDDGTLLQLACDQIMAELLAPLPARDIAVGPRSAFN